MSKHHEAEIPKVSALEPLLKALSLENSPSQVMALVCQIFSLSLSVEERVRLPYELWKKCQQMKDQCKQGFGLEFGHLTIHIQMPEATKSTIRFIETMLKLHFQNAAFRFLVHALLDEDDLSSPAKEYPEATSPLLTLLASTRDTEIQKTILSFLSTHPTLDCTYAFQYFLSSSVPEIRISCIWGLANLLDTHEAIRLFQDLLTTEPDNEVLTNLERAFQILKNLYKES